MKYIILIPSYEADNKLLNLLKEINKKYDTIVIDDGSKDKSIYDEVKKYAHLISYEINMGKGFALKTGFKYIKENYKDYVVVCMDSDGQHDLSDAIKLCDYVSEHKDVLALGSRNWDKTTPLRSRFGYGITRWVFKRKTGVNIHDNVVVGAGSVVTHDLESGAIYAGNPAKKIRDITKEDSIFLKKELW